MTPATLGLVAALALTLSALAFMLKIATARRPSDRLAGAHGISLSLAAAIAALGAGLRRPDLIDAAIVLMTFGFIGLLAGAKLLRLRSMQPPLAPPESGP
jgi:multisubunit Na+/H+ antiporter MnhF subunit